MHQVTADCRCLQPAPDDTGIQCPIRWATARSLRHMTTSVLKDPLPTENQVKYSTHEEENKMTNKSRNPKQFGI